MPFFVPLLIIRKVIIHYLKKELRSRIRDRVAKSIINSSTQITVCPVCEQLIADDTQGNEDQHEGRMPQIAEAQAKVDFSTTEYGAKLRDWARRGRLGNLQKWMTCGEKRKNNRKMEQRKCEACEKYILRINGEGEMDFTKRVERIEEREAWLRIVNVVLGEEKRGKKGKRWFL